MFPYSEKAEYKIYYLSGDTSSSYASSYLYKDSSGFSIYVGGGWVFPKRTWNSYKIGKKTTSWAARLPFPSEIKPFELTMKERLIRAF